MDLPHDRRIHTARGGGRCSSRLRRQSADLRWSPRRRPAARRHAALAIGSRSGACTDQLVNGFPRHSQCGRRGRTACAAAALIMMLRDAAKLARNLNSSCLHPLYCSTLTTHSASALRGRSSPGGTGSVSTLRASVSSEAPRPCWGEGLFGPSLRGGRGPGSQRHRRVPYA